MYLLIKQIEQNKFNLKITFVNQGNNFSLF